MKKSWLLFLFGLVSATHVRIIGYMPISELIAFATAPLLFFVDYRELKHDGFLPFLTLALLSIVGCAIACAFNETDPYIMARGFVGAYSTFAIPVLAHRLVRRNIMGVKWYFIGAAISAVITIWVLKPGYEEAKIIQGGADAFKTQGLHYMMHFGGLTTLPAFAFYFSSPTPLTIACLLITTVHAVATTGTGRAAALTISVSVAMIAIVHRKWSLMAKIKKRFFLLLIGMLTIGVCVGAAYKFAATHGLLNAIQQNKYESQVASKGKKAGMFRMLVSGRGEFFIALIAAVDNPIVGLGPLALDKKGYTRKFYETYATAEDIQKYDEYQAWFASHYGTVDTRVANHSTILSHWVGYGILGLIFWLYFLLKLFRLFRYHIDAVPQWFGYFAFMSVGLLWGLFFSPFAARVDWGMFFTLMLMATAVGKRKIALPMQMVGEAMRHDRQRRRELR